MDYSSLRQLRKNHPGWRLLNSPHAPLVAAFLYKAFIEPNERIMSQADLESKLDDLLYAIRAGDDSLYPQSAKTYLDEWAHDDKAWLRKFYPPGSDEPHFDLTPATEKALQWLAGLTERQFIGTESRLLTVFELLKQMVQGAEADPQVRIRELERQKAALDREIQALQRGEVVIMDDTALKERFMQITSTARELLGDFRAVEFNFRELDRQVREQIATWEGSKGDLLETIFGDRDAITDSDQGRSFRAFWDFLMSPESQQELSELLDTVADMPLLQDLLHNQPIRSIHFDWLEAGEHTQRMVAKLSQQLRRYLDDQAYLENKRIMQLLDGINVRALTIREHQPSVRDFMTMDATAPDIVLPMERPLFTPPLKVNLTGEVKVGNDEAIDAEKLFHQVMVDPEVLRGHIRRCLQVNTQVTLADVVIRHPLEKGLAELVTYLSIAGNSDGAVFDDQQSQQIGWSNDQGQSLTATVPRIVFTRGKT